MEKTNLKKELIKEFQETVCVNCKSYVFCGGECMCIHFEKFIESKKKK
jgi:radical SAM protein with 4Fe4S-binding SPASM domain